MVPTLHIAARWFCTAALLTGMNISAAGADDMGSVPCGSDHVASHAPDAGAHPCGPPFLAENAAAMAKMMADMDVKPIGDVDRDFVALMVPHHQGAIDMAKSLLRYGKNEQLRRLAQEIIVSQQQEIAAMRLAIGEPLPPSAAAPTQASAADTETFGQTGHHHPMPTK